jgi:formaldehyde-activating enzyme
MFGAAQHGVAKAIADSVAEGIIPIDEADDLFVSVGVFIHWDASDEKKFNNTITRPRKKRLSARSQRRALSERRCCEA